MHCSMRMARHCHLQTRDDLEFARTDNRKRSTKVEQVNESHVLVAQILIQQGLQNAANNLSL